MTYEEAINELKNNYVITNGTESGKPIFESIGLAIEALEKAELFEQIKWERDVALAQLEELGLSLGEKPEDRYRWHDLRKDPTDLPPHGRIVIIRTEDFGFGARLCTNTIGHWNEDKEEWRFAAIAYPIPIAWKEIDPFEVEE